MKTSLLLFTALSLSATTSLAGPFQVLKKIDRPNYSKSQLDRLTYQSDRQVKAYQEMEAIKESAPEGMRFQDGLAKSENLTEVTGAMVSPDKGKSGVIESLINKAEQDYMRHSILVPDVDFVPTKIAVTGFGDNKFPDTISYSVYREYNHNFVKDPKHRVVENGVEVKNMSEYHVVSTEEIGGIRYRITDLWKKAVDGAESSLSFNRKDFVGRERKGRTLDYTFTEGGVAKSMKFEIPDDLKVLHFELVDTVKGKDKVMVKEIHVSSINAKGEYVNTYYDISEGQLLAEKNKRTYISDFDKDYLSRFIVKEPKPATVQVVKSGEGANGMKIEGAPAGTPARAAK